MMDRPWYRSKTLLRIVLLPFMPLLYLFAFLESKNDKLNIAAFQVLSSVINLWWGLINFAFRAGVSSITIILLGFIGTLLHEVCALLGLQIVELQALSEAMLYMVNKPGMPAILTGVVAATVALGHLKNNVVNERRYRAEMHDRREKEGEKRRTQELERMKSFYDNV